MIDLDDAGCLLLPFKLIGFIFQEFLFEMIAVNIGRLVLWPFGKRGVGEFTAGMTGFAVLIAVSLALIFLI